MPLSNDTPINAPADDLFGLDTFAKALAGNIENLSAPEGTVLSINGPWGSGKSSAINLMKCHLADTVAAGNIQLVTFNPWWFAGADALTVAFFQELNAAIGPSLSEKARKAFSAIGSGVSAVGQVIATAVNLKAPGIGDVLGSIFSFLGARSKNNRTVEQEHEVLVEALREQKKRFLVIIDDIDRLNPDDALNIFRLVKSVGRLPNVIYLLAFDRTLSERLVAERFPSEGPSYLEKIIQTAFEIPPPLVDELRQQLLSRVFETIGQPSETNLVRFMNIFYDVVAPLLHTPRDMVRLTSELAATWPSISGNVDRGDFVALAAIRLSAPEIYQGIRNNPEALCGTRGIGAGRDPDIGQRYLEMLHLNNLSPREAARWQSALRRLFPKLDSIWANTYHQGDEWDRQRRVCSSRHFRTYFSYAVSDEAIPEEELQQLINRADDVPFVQDYVRQNIQRIRRNGTTRASLLLDELIGRSADIDETRITGFLSAIFSLGDELDIPSDEARGFNIGSNPLRIHWMCNRITERFDEARRDTIFETAAESAPLGWLCDFADRCQRFHDPNRQNTIPPLVTQPAANRLVARSIAQLREEAASGALASNTRLGELLFIWRRLPDGLTEVRQWTDQQLANDTFVINIAKTMTSHGWSQGMGIDGNGDRVARRNTQVHEVTYQEIIDIVRLNTRVDELLANTGNLSAEAIETLNTFRNAPRRDPRRLDD